MVEADVEVVLDKEFSVLSSSKNNVRLRTALCKQPEKKPNKSNNKLREARESKSSVE